MSRLIALRMSTDKKMIHFSELGIVGVLINSKKYQWDKENCQTRTRTIIQFSEEKTNELIKTLYVFLVNGGKLQKTMEDLSLSMSGLDVSN